MAIQQYYAAGHLWQADSSLPEAATAYKKIGDIYFIQGRYAKALHFYQEALKLRRASGDLQATAESGNDVGYAYLYLGENKKAAQWFQKSLDFYQGSLLKKSDPGVKRGQAQSFNNLAELQYSLGDLRQSEDLLKRALDLWQEINYPEGSALTYLNIGYVKADSGKILEALDAFQQSIALWRDSGNKRGEALALAAIGGAHSLLAEYQPAINAYSLAQELFDDIGEQQGKAVSLTGLGQAYEDINQKQAALDAYAQALAIHRQTGSKDNESVIRYNMGRVYLALKDYPQALIYYKQSLLISHRLGKKRVEAYALNDMATIYIALGKKKNYLNLYETLLRLYSKAGDRRGEAKTLINIGNIHSAENQPQKAIDCYTQSLNLSRKSIDLPGEAEALYHLARVQMSQHDLPQALENCQRTINIVENLRLHVFSDSWQISYFSSVQKYFELYIDLLMQAGLQQPGNEQTNEQLCLALQISERARYRSLLDSLSASGIDLQQGAPPELLEQQQWLQRELKLKALLLNKLEVKDASPDMAAEEESIRNLNLQLQTVEAKIKERSPRSATISQPQIQDIKAIQSELSPDTLLLEYYLGATRSYLWAVTADSITGYQLPDRRTLETLALEVYHLLTERQSLSDKTLSDYQARVAMADQRFGSRVAELSQLLLGPVAAQLDRKRVIVVSNGALQYVPFDALLAPTTGADAGESSPQSAPLLLSCEFISAPSISTLLAIRQRRKSGAEPTRAIAIFADPVFERNDPRIKLQKSNESKINVEAVTMQTRSIDQTWRDRNYQTGEQGFPRLQATYKEATAISAFFAPGESLIATGFDANLRQVTSDRLKPFRILHFATHGLINSQHVELSGLVFSLVNETGNPEMGFLQLQDIYALDLSADLVVLSACRTALGSEINGEGLIGLTQGFLSAGSKSVIASLWKVDDRATSELMSYFYEFLTDQNCSPATALALAKRKMWQQDRWRSPYYWAAFILEGEYRSTPGLRDGLRQHFFGLSTWVSIMAAALILAALLIALFYVRSRLRRSKLVMHKTNEENQRYAP